MLKLNNINHTKKKSIVILNAYHKGNVMHVL